MARCRWLLVGFCKMLLVATGLTVVAVPVLASDTARALQLVRSEQALFDKRFVITESPSELLLILPRDEESGRLVLVRPDGSKEYSEQHSVNVRWRSNDELDVIRLIEPEPGPWQLHMHLPDDKPYYVIDDFSARVNELPETVYQGEKLYVEVSTEVQGELLQAPLMGIGRIQVRISEGRADREPIFLISAIPDIEVTAEQTDISKRFSIPIDMAPGIYDMRLTLDFGIFRRELRKRFEVIPSPFFHQLEKADNYLLPHRVNIDLAEDALVHPMSIALQGNVVRPDGSQSPVAISPSRRWPKSIPIEVVPRGGIYQLSLTANVKLSDNSLKELRLPTFRFATPPDPLWLKEQEALRIRQENREKMLAAQQVVADKQQESAKQGGGISTWLAVLMIVAANLLIAAGGLSLIWWRKRRQNQQAVQEAVN